MCVYLSKGTNGQNPKREEKLNQRGSKQHSHMDQSESQPDQNQHFYKSNEIKLIRINLKLSLSVFSVSILIVW